MAKKQRGPLPPVLSTEETRVKPPEEDEELPPDNPSWDPQRDQTLLMPHTTPVPLGAEEEGADATPAVPRRLTPAGFEEPETQEPDEATRHIPRKASPARPEPETSDDATRHIPRKTGARPALQEEEDATRHIPRKTGARPALQEEEDEDSTRQIRKSGPRATSADAAPPTRPPARRSGSNPTVTRAAPEQESPLPWEGGEEDISRLPTRAQPLPRIVNAPPQALVYPPEGPPVLVPVNTEPHFLAQAPKVQASPAPRHGPPPPVSIPLLAAPPPRAAPAPQMLMEEPPQPGELRTAFSNKAAMVADLIKSTFARRSYGIAPYRLRVDEPDGPSTAGGLHARQPLSLVSNLDSAPAVVVGWVDVAKKESQLRSYGVVKRRHQGRYNTPLDITEEEYEGFFNELIETLAFSDIRVMVQVPDEQEPAAGPGAQGQVQGQAQAQPRPGGRSCLGMLLLLSLTFALGVGAGLNADFFTSLTEQVRENLSNR